MDDIWAFLLAFFVDIIHIKLLCQKGIPLDRDHSVFFAVYIFGIDVYFWSVESGFSYIFAELYVQFLQHLTDMSFCLFPDFCISNVFFFVFRIPFGQMIGYIFFQSQYLETILCQCDTVFKFFDHLVRTDDQVSLGIVNWRTRVNPCISPESSLRNRVDVSP